MIALICSLLDICDTDFWRCCKTWIGANDQDIEGVFQWTNKENVTYVNWPSGEPSSQTSAEDCVRICDRGVWNDVDCNLISNIICEKRSLS